MLDHKKKSISSNAIIIISIKRHPITIPFYLQFIFNFISGSRLSQPKSHIGGRKGLLAVSAGNDEDAESNFIMMHIS